NLSATNGTELNGARLSKAVRIKDGDVLALGHRHITLRLDSQPHGGDSASAGWLTDMATEPQRNCPKCRARVATQKLHCPTCGYRWPSGGPASPTQKIGAADLVRRAARRHIIRVPVIYSSEYLTLDCMARDLSAGGMYIASEILDPVGTHCHVTALPDGRGALRFEAVVCHVSTDIVHGRPPGFGVQFATMSEPARDWLSLISARKE